MLTRLALTLTMLAPPSEEAAQAVFNSGDYDQALAMYLARAADPEVHPPDAIYGAHDSLIALHARTGDAEHLCRALALARELLAGESFADAEERLSWVEIEANDVARIDKSGAVCAKPPDPPPVDEPATAADETSPAPAAKPEGPAPLPVSKDIPGARRPVARVAGGAGVLAVGVGLVGGSIASLVGRARADASIAAIDAELIADGRLSTASEQAEIVAANRRFVRLERTAAALGIAGIVSVLTGLAVMLAPTRAASRARVRARAAGLVYSF